MAHQIIKVTIIGCKHFGETSEVRLSKSFKVRAEATAWVDGVVNNSEIVDYLLKGISCILLETTQRTDDDKTDMPSLEEKRTEYIYEW